MIDKKIEDAKEEIYEDRFLLNGEEVVFDNDAKEGLIAKSLMGQIVQVFLLEYLCQDTKESLY